VVALWPQTALVLTRSAIGVEALDFTEYTQFEFSFNCEFEYEIMKFESVVMLAHR
jgi:hypothetical protein